MEYVSFATIKADISKNSSQNSIIKYFNAWSNLLCNRSDGVCIYLKITQKNKVVIKLLILKFKLNYQYFLRRKKLLKFHVMVNFSSG